MSRVLFRQLLRPLSDGARIKALCGCAIQYYLGYWNLKKIGHIRFQRNSKRQYDEDKRTQFVFRLWWP